MAIARLFSLSCLIAFVVIWNLRISCADDDAQRAKDAIVVKTLLRLPGVDLSSKPEAKAVLLRHLKTIEGSEQWLEIVEKFKLREMNEELLRLALENDANSTGVKAAGLLVKFDERDVLTKAIVDPDASKATKIIGVVGLLADAKTNDLTAPLIANTELPVSIRAAAVTALARNAPGQKRLLESVVQGKLAADLQFAAANALLSSADDAIRAAAGKHLSLPAGAGGEPLPPVAELVKRSGNAAR